MIFFARILFSSTPLMAVAAHVVWEDPAINAVNRLEARAVVVPCESRQKALEIAELKVDRNASKWIQSLNGKWRFKWAKTPEEPPIECGEIEVPSCWQLAARMKRGDVKIDPPIYSNESYPHAKDPPRIMTEPPKDFTAYVYRNPTGYYARNFDIPPDWEGRRVVVHFGGVASAMFVRVNGQEIGYSEDSRLPAEFDITAALKETGANLLEVKVLRWCDGSYLEDQDFWRMSGIYRDVWLVAETKEAPKDLRVEANPTTGEVIVRNEQGDEIHRETIPNATRWEPGNPRLYPIVFEKGGDWFAVEVGFRTVEIKDGQLLLNGKKVYFKGVNRHEMSPIGGYTVTREEMEKDLAVLKEYGFNAVRTCHYPNDPLWYVLCDQAGILVCSEANVESHGAWKGRTSLCTDPAWNQAHVERNVNHVKVLANHPSVVMWSLGNESGWGDGLRMAAAAVRTLDSSRPIHYEGVFRMGEYKVNLPEPNSSDIATFMYARPQDIEKWMARHDGKMPYIMCEYAHAMGNSTGDFAAYWKFAGTTKSFQGGFIWDFADQALLVDGALKYGGDFGDKPNDGNFNCNGLFDPFRRPHPGAFEVKKVFDSLDGTPPRQVFSATDFRVNLWRAPTDNDKGWKMPRECAIWKNATETQRMPEGVKSALEVKDGIVDWELVVPEGLPILPRVGLSFTVPAEFASISWYGRGPHENYPDRKLAAEVGIYSAHIEKLNPQCYVNPGEEGYRCDTECLELKADDGRVIRIEGERFGFNVWPWTQKTLENASHVEELRQEEFLTVNIDAAMMGVGGDNSWGFKPHDEYLLGAGTYRLRFSIRAR